jgi:hypothetical protein
MEIQDQQLKRLTSIENQLESDLKKVIQHGGFKPRKNKQGSVGKKEFTTHLKTFYEISTGGFILHHGR